MNIPKTIHLKDLDKPVIDQREQFIKSNPKNIPHELQLMLVDIQTEFAEFLLSPKRSLSNDDANRLWYVVREIFKNYGLE